MLVARAAVDEGHEVSIFLADKPAEFALPKRLVQLLFEADRSLTY